MKYRGDSPAKKSARLTAWAVMANATTWNWRNDSFLVLGGPELADARVLRGMGVPGHRICAVERDAESVEQARQLPWAHDVSILRGDLAHINRWMSKLPGFIFTGGPRRFRYAYLDFCGQLCPKTVSVIHQVLVHGMAASSVLAVNLLKGREFGEIGAMIRDARATLPECADDVSSVRGVALHVALLKGCGLRGWDLFPLALIEYESHVPGERGGSPMVTVIYAVRRDLARRPAVEKMRRLLRFLAEHPPMGYEFDKEARSPEQVRAQALAYPRSWPSRQVGDLLNVDPGTVAAWRAWQTRQVGGALEEAVRITQAAAAASVG